MTKTSTRLSATVAASMLGIALAASAAYAATGALTTRNAPGQVLQVSGVGPAAGHASPKTHAKTKVPSVAKPPHANAPVQVPPVAAPMPMAASHRAVIQVARSAPKTLPAYHQAMPQTTSSTRPAVPQPMMSPGAATSPSPMQ